MHAVGNLLCAEARLTVDKNHVTATETHHDCRAPLDDELPFDQRKEGRPLCRCAATILDRVLLEDSRRKQPPRRKHIEAEPQSWPTLFGSYPSLARQLGPPVVLGSVFA
jgi:hypothetical protein